MKKRHPKLWQTIVWIGMLLCVLPSLSACANPQSFTYQVRVVEQNTGEYVSDARVAITLSTIAPLDAMTDTNGFARILVSGENAGKPAELTVEASGYSKYRLNIDLWQNTLPKVIQLERKIPITPTPTLPPIGTPTPTPTSTPTWTPTPELCACQLSTDTESLLCLILAESEAVNKGSLGLIQKIFAPDAFIADRSAANKEWNSPMAYYQPDFAALDFTNATHFDEVITVTNQGAWATSGSSGKFAPKNTILATPYSNPNPSDHWTFGKDRHGCWVITRFEFNAMYVKFP